MSRKDLPKEISGGYSFNGGTRTESDRMIFYALHHSSDANARGDEVWRSEDNGDTWKQMLDPVITDAPLEQNQLLLYLAVPNLKQRMSI